MDLRYDVTLMQAEGGEGDVEKSYLSLQEVREMLDDLEDGDSLQISCRVA